MTIIDRTIDVFERRIAELEEIREISNLPRWTDADVIGANCLMEEYRSLTGKSSGMICFYCNQKFSYTGVIKCKINGQVIPREVLLSKEPYENCPIEINES